MTMTTLDAPLYSRPPNRGPDCSTARSARLRARRFGMYYETHVEPPAYLRLAEGAKNLLLAREPSDPALARALALRHVVEHCEITPEKDAALVGGENPFFFNLMLPALNADRHSREGRQAPDEESRRLGETRLYLGPCFEGHISPGVEHILAQGISGLQARIEEQLAQLDEAADGERRRCYEAMRVSCQSVLRYAQRLREAAEHTARGTKDEEWAAELRTAAEVLARVPEQPATTLHEALQSYWLVYCLITLEMGGCCPGGGLGLGRLDQSLYPYYRRDLDEGRLTRAEALELLELFLLNFRHCDYYTGHAVYTPGSQTSLGGVTPAGDDASNELSELIMEASLRLQNPAPYVSLRLHRNAPARYWQAAANYLAGGLGFPVVNDEVLIPAFVRHGRLLAEARDYICSCCYENTLPGREAFHPNGAYLNLPLVLELALNQGRSLKTGDQLGVATPAAQDLAGFDDVLTAFRAQLRSVCDNIRKHMNHADACHMEYRRYPLMSVFMDDCIDRGVDVCAGGARYNLTGIIVSGVPNVVNSLSALREVVFERGAATVAGLCTALQANFDGHENLRRQLLAAPKWHNGLDRVDALSAAVTAPLYAEFCDHRNARGGRFQVALYSFAANHHLGEAVGASPDGRLAGELLTRNLNPTWGTDQDGPTSLLRSLSKIDFTQFPNGSSLDLRFDPAVVNTKDGRGKFVAFLKAFVDLGVMTMQLSMVDTETLLDARERPEKYPNLMVKVAGYSARFVDLSPQEQEELINRGTQRLAH
ncbi:MAG: hypothetical protein COZ06_33825 [Armatimonadetes bacterium CG_4_10_14_3_um_filter_66_18]|nr:MAG: hypothetical protein COZ06_33825 [Armatimonadetes bacterium CG_4_10_14_3_um_filter_66_18]